MKAKEPLTIKPGPNNPVGLVWIDLTAPSYGIHGTPEPGKIGKSEFARLPRFSDCSDRRDYRRRAGPRRCPTAPVLLCRDWSAILNIDAPRAAALVRKPDRSE